MRKQFVLSSVVFLFAIALFGFSLYLLPEISGHPLQGAECMYSLLGGLAGMSLGLGGIVVSLGCESPQQGWFRLKSNFFSRYVHVDQRSKQPKGNFCQVSLWSGFDILLQLIVFAFGAFVISWAAYMVVDAILHASRTIHELTMGLASAFAYLNYTFLFRASALVVVFVGGYLLIRTFRKSALYRELCPLAEPKD